MAPHRKIASRVEGDASGRERLPQVSEAPRRSSQASRRGNEDAAALHVALTSGQAAPHTIESHEMPDAATQSVTPDTNTRTRAHVGNRDASNKTGRDAPAKVRPLSGTERQDKTKQNKTRQTRQDKTRQDKTRQDKTRQDKTRQDKTRQDKTRQDKTRQDKTRQDKTRQDKTRPKMGPTLSVNWPSGRERRVVTPTESTGCEEFMARLMTQPATRVLCQSTVQREVCTGQKLKTTPKSRRPFLHRGCACIPFSPVSRAIVRRVASCGSQFDLSFVQTPGTVHSVIDKAPSGRCPVDLRPRSCEHVAKTGQKMPWANFGGKRGAQLQEGQRPGTERASGGVVRGDPHATCKAHSHECLNSNGHECFF